MGVRYAARMMFLAAGLLPSSLQGLQAQRGDSTVVLRSAPTCSTCRIELVAESTLRPPTDSFWFGPAPRVVRLVNGSYLAKLEGSPSPILFAPDGRFERALMKTGDGPGEIGRAGPTFFSAAPDGQIWIFDGLKGGARHVFDRGLKYVRTDPRGDFRATESGFITASGEIVFAASIATRQRAGLPLHVAGKSAAILRSFGREDPTLSPRSPPDSIFYLMLRYVEPAPGRTFWSYNPSDFMVERWTIDGHRIYRIEHSFDGWYADVTREMQGLRTENYKAGQGIRLSWIKESATPNLVWFIYVVRTVNSRADDPSQPSKGLDIVVEAVDIQKGVVLAVRRFPETFIKPVWDAPDRIAVVVPFVRDFTTFRISRLTLIRDP